MFPAALTDTRADMEVDVKTQTSMKEQLKRDRACQACNKSKIKCDGERPCRSCIFKGKAEMCVDQVPKNSESNLTRKKSPLGFPRKALKRDQACIRCNKSKVKCDGCRPCGRCVSRGSENDCMSQVEYNSFISNRSSPLSDTSSEDQLAHLWNTAEVVPGFSAHPDFSSYEMSNDVNQEFDFLNMPIDRPIAFPAHCLAHSRRSDQSSSHDVPFLLRTFWENQGVSISGIRNIYGILPLRLKDTLARSLTALERLLNARARSYQIAAMDSRALRSWQQSARCGFQSITLDPCTNRWATCAVNEWLSEFAGVHREEMLARMANQEMQLPSTELRQFCAHLSGLLELSKLIFDPFCLKEGDKRYWVSRWNKNFAKDPCPEGVLMRACLTVHTDENGFLCGITRTQVVISEEEYDAALRNDPSACEALAMAVVGAKSGKELVQRELIQEESIINMVSTDKGMSQLNTLCDILDLKFRPIVDRAIAEGLFTLPGVDSQATNDYGCFPACHVQPLYGTSQAFTHADDFFQERR